MEHKEISAEDATALWEIGVPVYYLWCGTCWVKYPPKGRYFTNSPLGNAEYRAYTDRGPTKFSVVVE